MLVSLPKSDKLLLTSDAPNTLGHWNEKVLPGFLTFAVDTVRSVRKLRSLARRENAQVVTGRDPDAWSSLTPAPAITISLSLR